MQHQSISLIHTRIDLNKKNNYRQTYNVRRTPAGNNLADHSDVFGASPVGAAPTPSSFST